MPLRPCVTWCHWRHSSLTICWTPRRGAPSLRRQMSKKCSKFIDTYCTSGMVTLWRKLCTFLLYVLLTKLVQFKPDSVSRPTSVDLSLCPSVCITMSACIDLFVYLSVHVSVFLLVCLYLCTAMCLLIYLNSISAHLSACLVSVALSCPALPLSWEIVQRRDGERKGRGTALSKHKTRQSRARPTETLVTRLRTLSKTRVPLSALLLHSSFCLVLGFVKKWQEGGKDVTALHKFVW